MEYSISELKRLAGISARTLRYYDEIGLLKPARVSAAGYRYYGPREVDLLQQILFYREREVPLPVIREMIYREDFNRLKAMEEHLKALRGQMERIQELIGTVEQSIEAMKGEKNMSDTEKFAAFKRGAVEKNESKYGKEIREKYGDEEVEASNRKLLHMTQEEYDRFAGLGEEILEGLKKAVAAGTDPGSEEGKRLASLHREWLSFTWPEYTKEAHDGLVDMYLLDERFLKYYDGEVPGCAAFLAEAVHQL